MSVLTGSEVVGRRIVKGLRDPESQVQPAGVDLSLDDVERFRDRFSLHKKSLSQASTSRIESSRGLYRLNKGAYKITFAETIEIPPQAVGLVFPRSSLLRSGLTVHTALWDPGYRGKGSVLLMISNPYGAVIEKGARIAQLMIFSLSNVPEKTYHGRYQNEGLHSQTAAKNADRHHFDYHRCGQKKH